MKQNKTLELEQTVPGVKFCSVKTRMDEAEEAAQGEWRRKAETETGVLVSSAVLELSVLRGVHFLPAATELDSFGLPSRETAL